MKSVYLHVLLALLLAGPLFAQERQPPGVPARRGTDGLRMVPRDGKPEKDEKAAGKSETPAVPLDPFEAELLRLARWPSQDAREAAAALAIRGLEIEKRLIDRLPTAKAQLAAGICFVLGEIGGDASVAAVQRLAAKPSMAEYLPLIFDVLARLDGENATRRIFPFLRHPKRSAREAAEVWLRGRLNASHSERLEGFLAEPVRGARLSALRLLARVDQARARVKAYDLLGDEAPEVARSASEVLATSPSDQDILQLNDLVARGESRVAAYAILSLILIEAQTNERSFRPSTIPYLLGGRGLRSREKLSRASSAIALADIGYDSDVPEVDAVLDDEVVVTLLDSVGGARFYKDYSSFAELARDRFGKLTGLRERRPIPKLWEWWLEHEEGFTARRALSQIRAQDLGRMRIRARCSVEPALPTTLFSTVAGDAGGPEVLGIDFVFLPPDAATRLAAVISRELFTIPDTGAVDPSRFAKRADADIGPDIVVTVIVDNRSRTAVARGSKVNSPIIRVIEELRAVRSFFAWQRFWDRDSYPRYEDFIRVESEFFASGPSEQEKAEKLKTLVLGSLDDLTTATERTEAMTLLAGLSATISDSEAYRLALLLEEEPRLTPFTERVVEVLAAARRPLVLPVLAGWFEKQPGVQSMDLFVKVLAGLGEADVMRAAGSDRIFLRRAAVKAGATVLEREAYRDLLARSIRDESTGVRREAMLALGRSGIKGALSMLLTGLEDENAEVRSASIEGMGLLRSPEAVPVLARELRSDDLALRVGAIRALCYSGIEQALPPVLVALREDDSPLVRGVASREIVRFGEVALEGLSSIVMSSDEKPAARGQALESLVRIGKDHVTDVLSAVLGDSDADVADAAAFALALRGSKHAVPRLLDALEQGRSPVRTVSALEQVSGQTFPTALLGELPVIYRGWWNESKDKSEWELFLDSLAVRGYEVDGFAKMAGDHPDPKVAPTLIQGLSDPAWFVRANANLWLQRATIEDFGEVSRFTMEDDVRAVQMRWRAWWESR